jgi:uncharacterized membrane protein YkvA (DUF1232 family)
MNNNRSFIKKLKTWAKNLKIELGALYIACKRPEVPLRAKVVAGLVVGYAFSPIDLIPDFIPIIGYLDDLILLPLGIKLAIKLIPTDIMVDCRKEAEDIFKEGKPRNWIAGGIIILFWMIILLLIAFRILNS